VHLVGFTIGIYENAWSYDSQISASDIQAYMLCTKLESLLICTQNRVIYLTSTNILYFSGTKTGTDRYWH